MPSEPPTLRDDWTHLESPEAAATAISKMEALGWSAGEVAARQRYLDLLYIRTGNSVIDVGAGTGLTAVDMARRAARNWLPSLSQRPRLALSSTYSVVLVLASAPEFLLWVH
jgi:hypothetical protein